MSKTYFQFKQFGVRQERAAMKISTDGVLLGATAGKGFPKNVLEIGVGTGVVTLMMAQRFATAQFTGVEIDQDAWLEASENADQSSWSDRIDFVHQRFQDFFPVCQQKFDLIVSNPPYFQDHLKTKDVKRNLALHLTGLSFSELLEGVVKLLGQRGEFCVILPERQMEILEKEAASIGLFSQHKLIVKDRPGKPVLRVVASFSFGSKKTLSEEIVIRDEIGKYSEGYSHLLRDFLLIF